MNAPEILSGHCALQCHEECSGKRCDCPCHQRWALASPPAPVEGGKRYNLSAPNGGNHQLSAPVEGERRSRFKSLCCERGDHGNCGGASGALDSPLCGCRCHTTSAAQARPPEARRSDALVALANEIGEALGVGSPEAAAVYEILRKRLTSHPVQGERLHQPPASDSKYEGDATSHAEGAGGGADAGPLGGGDFRAIHTYVNVIRGHAELLQSGVEDPLGPTRIREAAERMAAELDEITSRLRQGAGGGEREGRFSFDVFWSEEDRAYVAALRRPSSWHFSGIGATPLDAMRELMVPIDMALEDEAASPAPSEEVNHGDR